MLASASRFFLCGATASGKSAVAALLCQRIGGEIINADAFQLYQGLDICTAKPTAEEQAVSQHHLYSVLGPAESCDAQRFHDLAKPAIDQILNRGHWPVVVGGSGLYVKSLTHGLAPLPKGDEALRAQLGRMTPEEKVAELLRLDPAAETNVAFSNDRYVSRALEICILTGRPQSELRQSWRDNQPEFMGALIEREREDLYDRINRRVGLMIQQGAVEEVKALLEESAGQGMNVVGTLVPTDSSSRTGCDCVTSPSPLPSPEATASASNALGGRGGSLLDNQSSARKRSPSTTHDVDNTRDNPWERAGVREKGNRDLSCSVSLPSLERAGVREKGKRDDSIPPTDPSDVTVGRLPDYGVFKAIGVKQIHAYLHGDCSLDQTIADIQQATRRYAKRQATWFKRETGFQTVCLSSDSTAQLAVERILELFPCLLQPPSSAPSLST